MELQPRECRGMWSRGTTVLHHAPPDPSSFTLLLPACYVCKQRQELLQCPPPSEKKSLRIAANGAVATATVRESMGCHWRGDARSRQGRWKQGLRGAPCAECKEDMSRKHWMDVKKSFTDWAGNKSRTPGTRGICWFILSFIQINWMTWWWWIWTTTKKFILGRLKTRDNESNSIEMYDPFFIQSSFCENINQDIRGWKSNGWHVSRISSWAYVLHRCILRSVKNIKEFSLFLCLLWNVCGWVCVYVVWLEVVAGIAYLLGVYLVLWPRLGCVQGGQGFSVVCDYCVLIVPMIDACLAVKFNKANWNKKGLRH